MSILADLNESINLQKLNGADHVDVRNAFFANYVAALMMLKLQDIQGLMVVNDHHHSALTKFSPTMSDLNFWGRAMFYADDTDIKNRMKAEEAKILAKAAAKVKQARVQSMMKVPLSSPEMINWNEVIGATLLLQHTFNLKSSYFNSIMRAIYKWDTINVSAKQKAINDTLMFLMQSDQSSAVIPHLRKLSNLVMASPKQLNSVAQKIVSFVKLKEDDGGGATVASGAGGTSAANIGTTNAILNPSGSCTSQNGQQPAVQSGLGGLYKLMKMSPMQVSKKGRFTIRAGKLIKKKVKSFKPKKFKAPDFLKPVKDPNKKEDNGLEMKGSKDAI
jgi:hypothetical protein